MLRSLSGLLILLWFYPAQAAADQGWSRPQGSLKSEGHAYLQPLRGYPGFETVSDAELTELLSGDSWALKLNPWVRLRAPESRAGATQKARGWFEAQEAWLEYSPGDWDIRAGNQVFAWGAADTVNPSDTLNSWDYIDPFDPRKLPLTAVKIGIHPVASEHFAAEAVFSPFFRESRLPIAVPAEGGSALRVDPRESRWLLGLPGRIALTSAAPAPVEFESLAASRPREWLLAARLRLLRFSGWDFSLSGCDGIDPVPRIEVKRRGVVGNPTFPVIATLIPRYYRERMLGVDGTGSVGSVGIRFEGAVRRPYLAGTTAIPPSSVFGVLGADYTVPGKVFGKAELYFNGSFVLREDDGPDPLQEIGGLPSLDAWDRDFAVAVELRLNERTRLGSRAIASLRKQDGWISPYFKTQSESGWGAGVAGDFFLGPATGFFGQFADDRRVTLSASVEF